MNEGTLNDGALLASLPPLGFAFILVLARCGAAIMLLPGLGEAEPPAVVRAGLAFALAVLLLPTVAAIVPAPPDSPLLAAGMVAAELAAGGLLGWLARLPSMALGTAGAIASYMLGLSSVVQTDPALGGQSAALGRLFGLAAPVLILGSGLYALPLQALAGSYQVLPPGTLIPAGPAAESLTGTVLTAFALAVQLAAPFILASVVFQAALGILGRLVPKLQLASGAVPGQILGGLALLGLCAAGLLAVWEDGVRQAWTHLPGL